MTAQLRDMVAAEDSSVVTQKDQHRRSLLPQRTEAGFLAVGILESNGAERGTQRVDTHWRDDTVGSIRQGSIVPVARWSQ